MYMNSKITPVFRPDVEQCSSGIPVFVHKPSGINPRVGIKKGAYAIESADVLISHREGIAGWLRDAIVGSLKVAGFSISNQSQGVPKPTIIRFKIKHAFMEPKYWHWFNTLHALVFLTITVDFPDGSRYLRSFKGHDWGVQFFSEGGQYKSAIESATQKLTKKLAVAVCQLVNDKNR